MTLKSSPRPSFPSHHHEDGSPLARRTEEELIEEILSSVPVPAE